MHFLKKIFQKKGFYRLAYKPGYYASPIPNLEDALKEVKSNYGISDVPAVDLNESDQFRLLKSLSIHIELIPFSNDHDPKFRYHFDNSMFQHTDGSILFAMIRELKPKRIIEVGSGYSSALMLDINDMYPDSTTNLTFIEPYPERLNSLIGHRDRSKVEIIKEKIQDVDLAIFDKLEENDILFLDTSHIVKTGSDVTFWTFNILPRLKKGVIIHIHDIFWPFNYSEAWVKEERCYSEAYLIRAFLMYNNSFQIMLFSSYLKTLFFKEFVEIVPFLKDHHGGGSLWLKKTN